MRRNQAAQLAPNDQVNEVNVESRIARFESDLGHLKKDVAQIAESVVNLQEGQEELGKEASRLREEVCGIKAVLPHLATTAEMNNLVLGLEARMQSQLRSLETQMVRWFIYTAIGAGSLAFTIAKLVP